MEQWKAIPGYPGYEVSDHGNVRCWRRRNARSKVAPAEPRAVKPVEQHGYLHVSLSIDGVVRRRRVHQLVLEAFVGPCPPGMLARHVVENDRTNCALWNLAWGTPLENQADRVRHGTDIRGSSVKTAKLTERQAAEIYSADGSFEEIGRRFGISRHTVGLIKRGIRWAHATGAGKVA